MSATGIGSAPFTDAAATVAMILKHLPQMPYWPQMVRLGYAEEMTPQAVRGLPCVKADPETRQVQVDPGAVREEELANFYEAVLAGDLAPFAMTRPEASGFFALLDAVRAQGHAGAALKGQVTGPVTFASAVKGLDGKPILYDNELLQAVCEGLGRKGAWQAEQFRQLRKTAVVFFDEPSLTGFGSAYLPISKGEAAEILRSTLDAARAAGPVHLGVHCCGNTDWSLLLEAPLDILSFDSYGYFDNLRLYASDIQKFFDRGGWLAWGLVPTGEELHREVAGSLWARFQGQVQQLAADLKCGVKEVLARAILTPACGMGYLTPEAATRAFALLGELSQRGQAWL
jgi:hypothetical protein